jgi:hypothetical protein
MTLRALDDPLLALGYSEEEIRIIDEIVSRAPPMTSEERARVCELLPGVKGPQRVSPDRT